MPITLTISEETALGALHSLREFAAGLAMAAQEPPASEPAAPEVAEAKKPGRKKAPAAEAVIDATPHQADIEDAIGKTAQPANEDAPMLTIEDVRERTRQFAKDGHMDEVAAEMTARGIKKMSEVDPEAGNKPSVKFAEYVAAIEARIAAKPKLEG
jgi:hypothetical protein